MNDANNTALVLSIIASIVETMQAALAARYARIAPSITVPTLSAEIGRSFVRIVETVGSSRQVHCFVEISTGRVFAAASWKGPNKRAPRGNALNDINPNWVE